jgi:biotin carboxyl carrier protein
MKLHAEVGDNKHDIEIKREGGKLFADVDGRAYELDVSEPEPGVFLFKHDGRVYEATVSGSHVRIGRNEFDVRLVDPKRLRGRGSDVEHSDGIAEIKTAMPGKVVRILVEAGAEIAKGDGVVVVEAMKMQNELKSPKAGVVKEVRISEGGTVSAGDILATIE